MERMKEKVASAKYITALGLTKGYLQIPLEKTTVEKLAFITSKGLYKFVVMPFGMKNAAPTFQRISDAVRKGLGFADAHIVYVEVHSPTSFPPDLLELRQVL